MHLTATTLSITIALVALFVNGDIIAFSGDNCDGNEGSNVACNDGCIHFPDRHSFRILVGGTRCVTAYQDSGCKNPVGAITNPGNGACSNVNTGTVVGSIKCSPNSFCPNIVAKVANASTAKTAAESNQA